MVSCELLTNYQLQELIVAEGQTNKHIHICMHSTKLDHLFEQIISFLEQLRAPRGTNTQICVLTNPPFLMSSLSLRLLPLS